MPIYFEGRLAKLLKSKWAQMAAVVGSEKRFPLVAADLIDHLE